MLTRLLEIEFDAGVWTDVFADVVAVSTRRGRNRELGAYETGTLTVELRNDARQYDPDHAAGAYFGKLRPNRRVRFRATYNAVTYPVFLGYIDRITQNYGGPNDATATIAVSDRTKILARVDLPPSAYAAEVGADTPAYWWRLGDPVGAAAATDTVGAVPAAISTEGGAGSTWAFGAAGLVVRDADGALQKEPGVILRADRAVVTGTAPAFTVEMLVQSEDPSLPAGQWLFELAPASGPVLYLAHHDGLATLRAAIYDRATGTTYTNSEGFPDDKAPHHVAVVVEAAQFTLYVDGIATGGATAIPSMTWPDSGSLVIGHQGDPSFAGWWGILDEFAVYHTALSSTRVAAHNAAMRTPWDGDLPGARLARILVLAGVDPADYDLDAGTTLFQSTNLGGSALGYAQKVEETEAGRLFVDRAGIIQFVGRDAAVTGTYLTSAATVVDHQGGGLPYRSSSSDVDEADIITRATVSREGSVAVTYSDADAVDEFGLIDDTHDGLLHDDDTYSLSYAQWLVNTHRTPGSRLGSVELELTKDPATMYPGILARELADRVTYKRQPQNVGATIDADMRVESIAHETGGHYWRTTLELSPFNLGEGGYPVFVWDVTRWDEHVWGI